jgi:hypothetical protein
MTQPATANAVLNRTAVDRGESSPSPPTAKFQLVSWSTALWCLALVALIIAVQAVVGEIVSRPGNKLPGLPSAFSFPWLDPRAAVTLFVGLLALAVGRAQFALGIRPYLSYSNLNPTPDEAKEGKKYLSVVVRNEGTGAAIIHQVTYHLRLKGAAYEAIVGHESLVQRLAEAQLKEDVDYRLPRFGKGATIGKDKEREVFRLLKMLSGELQSVEALDMSIQYRGLLGDLYEKRVFCIPRPAYRRAK